MQKIQLKSSNRDLKATTPKKLRRQGLIPAVLYGYNVKNIALSINSNEFEKVLRSAGESTIVDLLTEDGATHPVLIHDVQIHYLTSKPDHVDFYEVSMTDKLKAKVALEFTGEAVAVKSLGGVLVKILNEVEVESLPGDLPHNLVIDISVLKTFSDSLQVKDIKAPDKVTIITSGEEVIAKVQPPRDVEAELAVPVVEDISKVEGAAEEKPVEGAAPAEGGKPAKEKE